MQTIQAKVNQYRPRTMSLLPQEVRQQIPQLHSQEKLGGQAIAYAKFFFMSCSKRWYATEFDGEDTFFGFVCGHYKEMGYFCLSELEETTGPFGFPIERDLYFKPTTLAVIDPELFTDSEGGQ